MTAAAAVTLHRAVAEAWLEHGPAEFSRIVESAASGQAGESADLWIGQVEEKRDGSGDNPSLFRIGSAHLAEYPQEASWPVGVPLLDVSHLQIYSTPATRATAENMVQALLLRILSTYRPGLVQVHVWDVREMAGALPGLYPLCDEGLFNVHDPTQLTGLFTELSARITAIRSRVQARGYRSLAAEADAENDGVRTEPWTIAVLLGDGSPPDQATHAAVQRIARSGLPAGVSLITVDLPVTLPAHTETIILDGRHNRCTLTGPHARLKLDVPPARDQISSAARTLADWYGAWRMRSVEFADLLPPEFWTCSSKEGLTAPVGFTEDHQPVLAKLDDATPHALLAGPSGSGKTNVILAWISALTARYSPDELELYMLDFKEGVSFAQFAGGPTGERPLPHARLVGINVCEDREFGLALLRQLRAELVRRGVAAKQFGAVKLSELRDKDPHGRWPRIVAIIDEFQYLFATRDAVTKEAVALLEDIARRGRSFGIHLVLASQDVSGIEAFWARPGIFEQFTLRIGLPKAKKIMERNNEILATIPARHAVINDESGYAHGNKVARIPNASCAGTVDELQIALHEMWGDEQAPPVMLDGSATVDARSLWPAAGDVPVAVFGRAFTTAGDAASARLDARPGRNVAVLGGGAKDAPRVLDCAALGLVEQGVALDLVAFDKLGLAHAEMVAVHAPDARMYDSCGGRGDPIGPYLEELAREIEARRLMQTERTPRVVVMWEADAADTRLSVEHRTLLKQILHTGPEMGIHVMGWWRSAAALTGLLVGQVTREDIGVWVGLDVHGSAIGSAIPGGVAWEPRDNRGLVYDRDKGQQLFVVPTLDGGAA